MKPDHASDLRRYDIGLYSVTFLVAGCAAVAIVACALGSLPDPIALATVMLAAVAGVVAYVRPFSPAFSEEFDCRGRIESRDDSIQGYLAARVTAYFVGDTDIARYSTQGTRLEARRLRDLQERSHGEGGLQGRGPTLAVSVDADSLRNSDGVTRGPLLLPQARPGSRWHVSASSSFPSFEIES